MSNLHFPIRPSIEDMFRDLAVEKMDVVIYNWVLGIEKLTYFWNIKKNRTCRTW